MAGAWRCERSGMADKQVVGDGDSYEVDGRTSTGKKTNRFLSLTGGTVGKYVICGRAKSSKK